MKLLCPACNQLADAAGYRVEAGALYLRCAKCGNESQAGMSTPSEHSDGAKIVPFPTPAVAATPTPAEDADDSLVVPEGYCPKCIAPQRSNASACSQCGLVFANFNPEELRPSEAIMFGWRKLLGEWNDPTAHRDFRREAVALGELAAAGRLYRIRLARDPFDALAQNGRDEIIQMATAAAALTPSTSQAKPGLRWKIVLTVFVAGAALGAFVVLLRVLARFLQ